MPDRITYEDQSIKQKVIMTFWPIAVVFFCVFTPISFFVSHDYFAGWFLLSTFLFFGISMFIYTRTKNVVLITHMLCSLGIPVLIPWLLTGGPANSGFWWSLVYIIWAFLIAGKRIAIVWLTAHLIISVGVVVLSKYGYVKIAYDVSELLNILFAYLVIFILVLLFNNIRQHYFVLSNKRAEELSKINKELNAANKELEQFAYVASHDLQEPLRNITNYVGLLEKHVKENIKSDHETNHFLEVITRSSERMKVLIKELLTFSRIGRSNLHQRIDCNKILTEVISDLDYLIQKEHAVILKDKLPTIKGNRLEIRQLFQNLISNALKFKRSGIVPEIQIRYIDKESEWEFAISDNGIGIDEAYLNKIFLLFQRLHSEIEYPGTGIGLATCKKIVESNGGRIWVVSKKDNGSTFYFTLPKI